MCVQICMPCFRRPDHIHCEYQSMNYSNDVSYVTGDHTQTVKELLPYVLMSNLMLFCDFKTVKLIRL